MFVLRGFLKTKFCSWEILLNPPTNQGQSLHGCCRSFHRNFRRSYRRRLHRRLRYDIRHFLIDKNFLESSQD